MKKVLTVAFAFLLLGCNKHQEQVMVENVTFTLDFYFAENGSMGTRTGSELFDEFYQTKIKSKQITPNVYELTFSQNKIKVATFRGEWGADLITLPEGTYTVTGCCNGDFKSPQLIFNEEITVQSGVNNIVLSAIYDCSLVFFAKSQVDTAFHHTGGNYGTKTVLSETEKIYYGFIEEVDDDHYVYFHTVNGDSGDIYIKKYNLMKGKYYYFDVLSGDFNVPPMDSGF